LIETNKAKADLYFCERNLLIIHKPTDTSLLQWCFCSI
jgi:hypothetical protein